jgi:hypothetical protein
MRGRGGVPRRAHGREQGCGTKGGRKEREKGRKEKEKGRKEKEKGKCEKRKIRKKGRGK